MAYMYTENHLVLTDITMQCHHSHIGSSIYVNHTSSASGPYDRQAVSQIKYMWIQNLKFSTIRIFMVSNKRIACSWFLYSEVCCEGAMPHFFVLILSLSNDS